MRHDPNILALTIYVEVRIAHQHSTIVASETKTKGKTNKQQSVIHT